MKNNAFKINKKGHLEIKRAGKFKLQSCPYGIEFCFCGDWCPLFQEPDYGTLETDKVILPLCRYDLSMKAINFLDERTQD